MKAHMYLTAHCASVCAVTSSMLFRERTIPLVSIVRRPTERAHHIAMQVKKGVDFLVPKEADLQRHVRMKRQGILDREKGDQSTRNLRIREAKTHTRYDLLTCFWWGCHHLLTKVWRMSYNVLRATIVNRCFGAVQRAKNHMLLTRFLGTRFVKVLQEGYDL